MAKKMGRPPIKAKDRRAYVVPVRFRPGEHQELLKDAKAAGMTVSSYLVDCWQKARK